MADTGPTKTDNVQRQDEQLEKAPSPGDSSDTAPGNQSKPATTREDGKIEIKEKDNHDKLGYSFSNFKKWTILTVIFWVQVSMNFNTSIYANAVMPLTKAFKISGQAARTGQMIYLVAYAFGSELWAPWSEDLGRWPVLQLSLFLVNVWEIPCALAPNFSTIIGFRFLGGLSSAGGSVTLGLIADMWDADDQQYAVAYIVLSSVGGSVLGPIIGAFVQRWLTWHWNFWIQVGFYRAFMRASPRATTTRRCASLCVADTVYSLSLAEQSNLPISSLYPRLAPQLFWTEKPRKDARLQGRIYGALTSSRRIAFQRKKSLSPGAVRSRCSCASQSCSAYPSFLVSQMPSFSPFLNPFSLSTNNGILAPPR